MTKIDVEDYEDVEPSDEEQFGIDEKIGKLIFPTYECEIGENGSVFLSDHYAEHMIYIYPSQFKKILKLYIKKFSDVV